MAPPATEDQAVRDAIADLGRAASTCEACKLCEVRTQVVFGAGTPVTPMVLAGQSPGEQEDASGEPFVGPAGQLLTECLARCRIKRHHIWITNLVKCRPWVPDPRGRGRNRDPEEDEIQACRQWIDAELALIRPLVIVAVGRFAAETLLGRPVEISKQRGTWFTEHPYKPAQIMPVLHPAYILRNGGAESAMTDQLAADLEQARSLAAKLRNSSTAAKPPAKQPTLFEADEAAGSGATDG